MIVYVLLGLLIVVSVMYLTYRQHTTHLRKVNHLMKEEAKSKGLSICTITSPSLEELKEDPFDQRIKIGTLGFYGLPTNEYDYRILDCEDMSSGQHKRFWVKVTHHQRIKKLTTEWREI